MLLGTFDDTKWRHYQWASYRLIEKVDKQIGVVLDALHASPQEQNTLVILVADHGDCQGAHNWNQKTALYDDAARVPFVVSLPGTIKPKVSDKLVNTGIDLIPTLRDYAGIPVPSTMPGISVTSPRMDVRKFVVISDKMLEGAPLDNRKPNPAGRMLRTDRYH